MEFLLGRSDEARSLLVGALGELPDQRSAEAATLKLALAWVSLWKLDYEQAGVWAPDVLAQAVAARDRTLEAIGASSLRPLGVAARHRRARPTRARGRSRDLRPAR